MNNSTAKIHRAYTTFRGEESLDYLSDSLLWEICKAWYEQESDLSFGDFVDWFLETGS